jgi:hypothetical protein
MPAAPAAPAVPAPDAEVSAQIPANEPIGNVATLTGTATVIRNRNSLPLQLQDDIYPDDTLRTAADSTLGVTFNDGTTFNLTANSRITVDNFVYEDGGKQNSALFGVAKGTVAFVAASVAKTGDMRISTPTATLGIRGTTGLIEVPEGVSAASASNVAIKLYPDPDGRVGRIEISDHNGARLGALTRGASGFAIRASAGGARFAAVPLTIPPQQVARDQGFVRQVHAAQTVGRQVVTEQRAFRRANPGVPNPNRGRPPGQPQPNGLPGQNRTTPQQPGNPNRPGQQQQNRPGQPPQPGAPGRQGSQQQRPGSPQQPGVPPRPGQPSNAPGPSGTTPPPAGQPPAAQQQPRQGGIQQGAPGAQPPGLQNQPAQPPRRTPAPPRSSKPPPKQRHNG